MHKNILKNIEKITIVHLVELLYTTRITQNAQDHQKKGDYL